MTTHDDGAPLEGRLGQLARDYHRPPEVPREAMWAAIEARIGEDAVRRREAAPGGSAGGTASVLPFRRRARRWSGLAAAAAAVLALGIGIGRGLGPTAEMEPAPTAAATEGAGGVLRAAAVEHLSRSEDLLALVRTDARAGRIDPAVGRWGRDLLVETRLLLDSPAAADPDMRRLLEDVELLLVQVALLGGEGMSDADRARSELDIIARGMEDNDVLTRIRAAVPAVPGLTGT